MQNFAAVLRDALDKLPDYSGRVVRGIDLAPKRLSRYRPGDIVTEPWFTSATKGTPYRGNTLFHIRSRTGKDISTLSADPDEREVLFRNRTRFRVLDVEFDDQNGYTLIDLEEV